MSSAGFPGMATMSAVRRAEHADIVAAEQLGGDGGAGLQGSDRAQSCVDHRLELEDAVAEGEHAAVGAEGDLHVACGHQPLGLEDLLVVAAELPDGLAGQRAGSQLAEVLLGHLHGRHDVRAGRASAISMPSSSIR